jgi:hypothetical protein
LKVTQDGTGAMFGWLKSKSRGEGTTANTGPEEQMLDAAIREVHPDRFASDIDAALVVQPKLATINLMLGRSNAERFLPIKLDDVVQRVRELQDVGRLQKFFDFAPNPVMAGLITAALQEGHPLGAQLRHKTEFLISCLNSQSKTTLEPTTSGVSI